MTAHRHVFTVHRHGPIRGHRLGWERFHAHMWWRHDHPRGVGERGWRRVKAAVLVLAALSLCALTLGPIPTEPKPIPTVYAISSIPPSYDMEAERAHLRHAQHHLAARRVSELPPRRLQAAAARSRRAVPSGAVWDRLAACEASGNPRAVSPSGRYRGLYQFDLDTWRSVGMTGDPIDHPASVQLEAGKRLHARRGWQPWPACARKLGLRP